MADVSLSDILIILQDTLTRVDGLIIIEPADEAAAPAHNLGGLQSVALDLTHNLIYGPKTADPVDPWGQGRPTVGSQGPAGTIVAVSVEYTAHGTPPEVALGGTPSARTILLKLPAPRDGDDGVTPNVSAAVTMIAQGQPALVTRSGPDSAPVFTFQLPRAADGSPGREVEMQGGATHMQWRYVGDVAWANLYAKADLQGVKGDKGDAFAFDAKPADMSARAAYDAEPEGFTVLVMDTGMVYARIGATPGVWSDGFPFGQTQNAILEALSELNATPGLLYQSGAAAFEKRAIGAASDTDVPDRLAADGRYRLQGAAVPLAEVSGLSDALDDKADGAATLVLLGGKADKADTYTKTQVDDLIPAFATKEEVWAGAVGNKIVPPSVLKAALEFQSLALVSNVATMNCHAGINFTVAQLTANATLANPTNKVDGRDGKINFSYDASARTLSVGSDWKKFAASPAIPTAANSKFTIVYSIIGTDVFYSVLVKP